MLRSFSASSKVLHSITITRVTNHQFKCLFYSKTFPSNYPKTHFAPLKNVYLQKYNISTLPLHHFITAKQLPSSILKDILDSNSNFSTFLFQLKRTQNFLSNPRQSFNISKRFFSENNNFLDKKSDYIIYILIAINLVVFALWQINSKSINGTTKMMRNFTICQDNIDRGYYWTIITANFSHASGLHLITNMLPLYFFGRPVLYYLGARKFLGLYLFAGIFSSFSHLLLINSHKINRQLGTRIFTANYDVPSLGASGSVFGISTLCAILYPWLKIVIFPIPIPIPMIVGVTGYVGWEILALSKGFERGIAHEAHLGGSLYGLLYYAYLRRRYILK